MMRVLGTFYGHVDLQGMCEELTGVKGLTYEAVLFGLCSKKERVLWLFLTCVKEVLWDVRNLYVHRREKHEVTIRMVLSCIFVIDWILREVWTRRGSGSIWRACDWFLCFLG